MRARKAALLGAFALGAAVQCASANPYQPIIERNPFGLKPPPPPQSDTIKEEQAPPPNVRLTGISNLFQKRALLEVTEQGAAAQPPRRGQAPAPASGTVHRPILAENEAAFGIEVLAIDVEKNIVKIRNNGVESELTFEAPKLSGPAPGAPNPQPGQPNYGRGPRSGLPEPQQQSSQPTVISSQNAQTTGGGGVTMLGGTTAGTPNNSGVATYGGTTATPAPNVPSPLGYENGLRTIPQRTVRTPTGNTDNAQVDPAQQAIMMEAQRLREQQRQKYNNNGGPIPPPLPPTPFSPQNDQPPPPEQQPQQ